MRSVSFVFKSCTTSTVKSNTFRASLARSLTTDALKSTSQSRTKSNNPSQQCWSRTCGITQRYQSLIWRRSFVSGERPLSDNTKLDESKARHSSTQDTQSIEGIALPDVDTRKSQAALQRSEDKTQAESTSTNKPPGGNTVKARHTNSPTTPTDTTTNNGVDEALLPSHTASNRSVIVARFHTAMERLLQRITIASQRVNTYTGTDYSGIESLRTRIKQLEASVKVKLEEVAEAKETQASATNSQSASQKEVVQLLERKHSWSAPDLERYMTLIRSEHVNEQAVQAAKDGVASAERDLEEVRARLEKYERRQYHEEQIWSDTIRRNSTWVTFGLMGVNILLLLVSLILIEPWRRRRLVQEMKNALDARTLSPSSAIAAAAAAASTTAVVGEHSLPTAPNTAAVVGMQDISESIASPDEAVGSSMQIPGTTSQPSDTILDIKTTTGEQGFIIVPQNAHTQSQQPQSPTSSSTIVTQDATEEPPQGWNTLLETLKSHWTDAFSDQKIELRRIDLTTTALQGVAAGAACMSFLFFVLARFR